MPNLPIRDLGSVGIIKDRGPYDLPPNGFSDGVNVRFHNGKLMRAPVFRKVLSPTAAATPRFCIGGVPTSGFDFVITANDDGHLYKVISGSATDYTPLTGFTAASDSRPWTGTTLSQVIYVNQPVRQPYYLGPLDTVFKVLPGWDATWTCSALRQFKGFLLALNVTKGAASFPTMVKWSDLAPAGAPPTSWDQTDLTKNAGENPLTEIKSPLVDGAQLGNAFVLYTKDEVVLQQFISGKLIFSFTRLPFDSAGVINQNCVAEIEGKHFVFGREDIYVHDGVTKQSIIDDTNRLSWFRTINVLQSDKFFVAHDTRLSEVLFCAVAGGNTGFQGTAYCNYAAVYNYRSNTWSFRDLPNVTAATRANVNTVLTYSSAAATLTYDNVGGSYYDQENSYGRHLVMTSVAAPSVGLSVSKLLACDLADLGQLALERDSESDKPAYAERTGIDLDNVGAEIRGYKYVRAIMPQVRLFAPATLTVEAGGHDTSSGTVQWFPAVTFDPVADYKVDAVIGGRYLAGRFTMPTPNDFEVSGFDLDAVAGGRR